MSQNKYNNGKLISHLTITDPVTGECYIEEETIIQAPENIVIRDNDNGFYKTRKRCFKTFNKNEIGYFIKLVSNNIEYNTGKLRIGCVGKKPIPIKTKKQISQILDIDRKTTSHYIKSWENKHAIFKIDSFYYINPSFIQFGKSISLYIFNKMANIDIELRNSISKLDKKKLRYFK